MCILIGEASGKHTWRLFLVLRRPCPIKYIMTVSVWFAEVSVNLVEDNDFMIINVVKMFMKW